MEYSGEAEILLTAKELLAGGTLDNSFFPANAIIAQPLPVIDPAGSGLHSWWVPLTAGDRLIAFFQFLKNGSLMRSSSFQRHKDNYESCPLATDWLDEDRVRQIAAGKIRSGEVFQKPYFTYDNAPERLVWAVPVTHAATGKDRIIYVAGAYAYDND